MPLDSSILQGVEGSNRLTKHVPSHVRRLCAEGCHPLDYYRQCSQCSEYSNNYRRRGRSLETVGRQVSLEHSRDGHNWKSGLVRRTPSMNNINNPHLPIIDNLYLDYLPGKA